MRSGRGSRPSSAHSSPAFGPMSSFHGHLSRQEMRLLQDLASSNVQVFMDALTDISALPAESSEVREAVVSGGPGWNKLCSQIFQYNKLSAVSGSSPSLHSSNSNHNNHNMTLEMVCKAVNALGSLAMVPSVAEKIATMNPDLFEVLLSLLKSDHSYSQADAAFAVGWFLPVESAREQLIQGGLISRLVSLLKSYASRLAHSRASDVLENARLFCFVCINRLIIYPSLHLPLIQSGALAMFQDYLSIARSYTSLRLVLHALVHLSQSQDTSVQQALLTANMPAALQQFLLEEQKRNVQRQFKSWSRAGSRVNSSSEGEGGYGGGMVDELDDDDEDGSEMLEQIPEHGPSPSSRSYREKERERIGFGPSSRATSSHPRHNQHSHHSNSRNSSPALRGSFPRSSPAFSSSSLTTSSSSLSSSASLPPPHPLSRSHSSSASSSKSTSFSFSSSSSSPSSHVFGALSTSPPPMSLVSLEASEPSASAPFAPSSSLSVSSAASLSTLPADLSPSSSSLPVFNGIAPVSSEEEAKKAKKRAKRQKAKMRAKAKVLAAKSAISGASDIANLAASTSSSSSQLPSSSSLSSASRPIPLNRKQRPPSLSTSSPSLLPLSSDHIILDDEDLEGLEEEYGSLSVGSVGSVSSEISEAPGSGFSLDRSPSSLGMGLSAEQESKSLELCNLALLSVQLMEEVQAEIGLSSSGDQA